MSKALADMACGNMTGRTSRALLPLFSALQRENR